MRTREFAAEYNELRTLSATDLLRAIGLELRRRDQGFLRVIEAYDDTGEGTYESHADGKTATHKFTFKIVDDTSVVILTPKFAPPQDAVTRAAEEYAPPDPYAAGIRALQEENRR